MTLTPEEKALRDMWIREMWAPVPEWRATKDDRADAAARNEALADRSREASSQLRTSA